MNEITKEFFYSYIDKGLSPIPIIKNEKRPAITNWTRFAEELPSRTDINHWLRSFPYCGLGLVLGTRIPGSSFYLVAIDIDQEQLVQPVKVVFFSYDVVYVSKKGLKGETIFAVAEDRIKGSKWFNEQGMGIEILSYGQQTVMPPSLHPEGVRYQWIKNDTLLNTPLGRLPVLDENKLAQLKTLAQATSDDVFLTNRPYYRGHGKYSNVEMVYPGNVNVQQRSMAASAARWNYVNDKVDEESKTEAVEGILNHSLDALNQSKGNEHWDVNRQRKEIESQYDRAMQKGNEEWNWKDEKVGEINTSSAKPLLRVVSARELLAKPAPARKWIVDQWIPDETVTLLYGHGGIGKTILCQQLMVAAAMGKKWLGLPTTKCNTMGLFCEDDINELHLRLERVKRHYNPDTKDLEHIHLISRPAEDNTIINFTTNEGYRLSLLWHELVKVAKKREIDLLIIDTLADTFGGNENVRTEVRKFVANCLGGIAKEVGCAVLVTGHPSRAGLQTGSGDSGSTAWHNSVRSRLYLDNSHNNDERVLKRMKSNYASMEDSEIQLRWNEGVFEEIAPLTDLELMQQQKRAQEAFMQRLDVLTNQQQYLSSSPNATNYAPKVMAQMQDEHENITKESLVTAMNNLLQMRKIRIDKIGPPTRARQRLVKI